MNRHYSSAVSAASEGLRSQHGWLGLRWVVQENILQRSRLRSVREPVATVVTHLSLVSLVPEGLDRVKIRGFPGGVNPESDANRRANQQTPHPPVRPKHRRALQKISRPHPAHD